MSLTHAPLINYARQLAIRGIVFSKREFLMPAACQLDVPAFVLGGCPNLDRYAVTIRTGCLTTCVTSIVMV